MNNSCCIVSPIQSNLTFVTTDCMEQGGILEHWQKLMVALSILNFQMRDKLFFQMETRYFLLIMPVIQHVIWTPWKWKNIRFVYISLRIVTMQPFSGMPFLSIPVWHLIRNAIYKHKIELISLFCNIIFC